jgi:hypothetical protein
MLAGIMVAGDPGAEASELLVSGQSMAHGKGPFEQFFPVVDAWDHPKVASMAGSTAQASPHPH